MLTTIIVRPHREGLVRVHHTRCFTDPSSCNLIMEPMLFNGVWQCRAPAIRGRFGCFVVLGGGYAYLDRRYEATRLSSRSYSPHQRLIVWHVNLPVYKGMGNLRRSQVVSALRPTGSQQLLYSPQLCPPSPPPPHPLPVGSHHRRSNFTPQSVCKERR